MTVLSQESKGSVGDVSVVYVAVLKLPTGIRGDGKTTLTSRATYGA